MENQVSAKHVNTGVTVNINLLSFRDRVYNIKKNACDKFQEVFLCCSFYV